MFLHGCVNRTRARTVLLATFFVIGFIFLKTPSSILKRKDYNNLPADTSSELCKKYHVALIVATPDEARRASFFLKTLMYHRRSPVHLHLLVCEVTHLIMKTLMETWELVEVEFTLYNVNSEGCSPISMALLKFHLPDFIPEAVAPEVVYFDNDVRLLDDVRVFWNQIEKEAGGNRYLGLVIRDSCGKSQDSCFGDSIIYFHMKKLRRSILRTSLLGAKTMSEVEAILKQHCHDFVFNISCEWDIHLDNAGSHHSKCVNSPTSVKAVLQKEVETTSLNDPILKKISEHIEAVLSSEPPVIVPFSCSKVHPESSPLAGNHMNLDEKCIKFKNAAYLKRRTHLYYLGVTKPPGYNNSQEVTLLTQLTMDRFSVLERLLGNWAGPATVIFHLSDAEAMELRKRVEESRVLQSRKSVSYHVVYKRQTYNPINYLRNVALNNSHSPYLFFVDVDLIPNPGLYSSLRGLVKTYMAGKNSKTVLVVPSFQMFQDLGDSTPVNKSELVKLMSNKTIVGYGMERSWNRGHKPTNYGRWISSDKPYQAIFADAYEPYVVVKKEFEARYNELLIERMGDKIAYIRLLHGQGFDFFVIPKDFVIHVPHPISSGSLRFKSDANYFRCSSRFFEAYRKELHERFPKRKF